MSEATRLPNAAPSGDLRLADFIRLNVETIVAEWTTFARTRTPASDSMTQLALQDHIVAILHFVADDLESSQSATEQLAKSRGLGPLDAPLTESAAQIHAALRFADGFDIDQMVSEYRALRASVVKQWVARNQALADTDLTDLTRFNEAIDQAMTESVARYTQMITHSRNLFLGILGHDLRNPIGAASMAARMMVRMGAPDAKQTLLASQIVNTTERATHILDDLLDITRTAFGTEIPIIRVPMDMGELCVQLAEEMGAISNGRSIVTSISGNCSGEWDQARMGQVFSNLLGNAIQYSPDSSEIILTVTESGEKILISVHNDGEPISPEKLTTIFDAMKRASGKAPASQGATNLGLGLFIAKKIVTAHGGELSVTSDRNSGTTFTAVLPRCDATS